MTNGKLATIEGIDGSGKSTITRRVVKKIKKRTDTEVIKTKEPTETWLGDSVKKGLRQDIDPLAEAFLFTADHIEHVEKEIRPKLKEGKLIISDRYNDSFYAYQGATLSNKKSIKNPIEYLKNLRNDFTIKPDLTIFLDVSPEVAINRLGEDRIKFENLDFQRKVYHNFKKIIKEERDRFLVVNGEKSKQELTNKVVDSLVTSSSP